MRIILLGLPGSGKEQLARSLGDHYKVPVLTLENTLTEIAAEKTELGRLVKEAAFAGKFSDELIMAALRIRLARADAQDGFIMEDFPRSTGQAETLDILLKGLRRPLNAVVKIDIEPDDLMEHLVGQITCQNCGAKYNIYNNPPIVDGMCNECGERIRSRPDDYEENIANRLRNCEMIMMPLERFYGVQNKMLAVPGNQVEKKIVKKAVKLLDALPPIEIPEDDTESTLPMDESLLKALMAPKNDESRPRRRGRPPRKRLQQEMAEITAVEEAREKAIAAKAAAGQVDPAGEPLVKTDKKQKTSAKTGKTVKKKAAKPAPSKKAETKKARKKTAAKPAVKSSGKTAAKTQANKKAETAKKAASQKKTAKTAQKKVVKKKAVKKKVVQKKVVQKKTVTKKITAKKVVSKSPVKKKVVKKAAVKKKVAGLAVTKKKVTKKRPVKKAPVKKATVKKNLVKKTAAKKKLSAKPSKQQALLKKTSAKKKVVKKKVAAKKKPAKKKASHRR